MTRYEKLLASPAWRELEEQRALRDLWTGVIRYARTQRAKSCRRLRTLGPVVSRLKREGGVK